MRAFVGQGGGKEAHRLVIYVPSVVQITDDILTFVHDLRQQKVPATVILEERSSLWSGVAADRLTNVLTSTYELSTLSSDEIDAVLESLRVFGALDRLEAYTEEERRSHFSQLAGQELLVALRELTTNTNFDQLVREEYNNIPSTKGKEAYLYAAAIGHIGLHLRYEVLRRLLKLDFGAFRKEIFAPTHGVLISIEEAGGSKYTEGFRLRTRHPTIASVVFDAGAPSDAAKVKVIEALLANLDLGFPEDQFLIRSIAMRRQLTQTIGAPQYKRAIFERLEELLPNDPYVLQHRAILERELSNPAEAMKYAKRAVQMKPNDLALENTLGLAYDAAARAEADPKKRLIYRQEASKLFEHGIESDPGNAYGYIGKVQLIQHQDAASPAERAARVVEVVGVLREAYEATDGHSAIAGLLADAENDLGHSAEALTALRDGLAKAPKDDRLRSQLAEVLLARNELDEVQKTLRDGIAISPMSWRLYRDLARVCVKLGKPKTEIRGLFESAIRNRQGDPQLLVEYGAFMFQAGEWAIASAHFERALSAERQGKRRARRVVWRDDAGPKVFSGTVSDVRGGIGFVRAVPEGFEARFLRTGRASALHQGEAVAFAVNFTAMGAEARIGTGKPPK